MCDARLQLTLFDRSPVTVDASFSTVRRIHLDPASWLDHAPGWVGGSDALFLDVLRARSWRQRERWMYDHKVREPRLTDWWSLDEGVPLQPGVLEKVRQALSARYAVAFDSAGFNLYRDGSDSVAWHGDRIEKSIEEPIVALVSLGEQRTFLLRPKGGGRSRALRLGRGDLLVTGGRTQRSWEHCVPKVARSGARITVAFRHGVDRGANVYRAPAVRTS